jgi:hypothetical protein
MKSIQRRLAQQGRQAQVQLCPSFVLGTLHIGGRWWLRLRTLYKRVLAIINTRDLSLAGAIRMPWVASRGKKIIYAGKVRDFINNH